MKPLLFLALCLSLALPAVAATDPFAEFRIPEHSWRSGFVAAGFSAGRNHQDGDGVYARASWLSSLLQSRLAGGWDSDALQYGYGLELAGRVQTGHSRSGATALEYRTRLDDVDRSAAESWRLDGLLRSYPLQTPLALGISALATGDYGQNWRRADNLLSQEFPEVRRSEARQTSADHVYQTLLHAELFAGFGRVRDASVVHDVHVLEERLIETGALTRPLSAQARSKLAALYYVAPFYAQAHERQDRYVWRDLERILREDGALHGDGLDAYSVLRARERTAPARRPARQRGWFIGVAGGITTTHFIARTEWQSIYRSYLDDVLEYAFLSENTRRSVDSYDQVLVGGEAEYHLPAGWRWQFDAWTRLTCPVRAGERGLDQSSGATASWYVSDRWAADASLQQSRSYFMPDGNGGLLMEDRWNTYAAAGIAYFLEDRTSLSLSFIEQQERALYSAYSPRVFRRGSRVALGISYRFLGGMDAPGLIEPVRPMH
jgi:hypothetical protein